MATTYTIKYAKGFAFVGGDLGEVIEKATNYSRTYRESVDVFEDIDGDDCFVCAVDASVEGEQSFITFASNLVTITGGNDAFPF